MTHPSLSRTGVTPGRDTRRWSPRFGYSLMIGGSALVWGAAALALSALV
ncbi:hypothetical protein [Brevundimonas sp.]|nr:hypothetical protein [Brevundimonas sp.]